MVGAPEGVRTEQPALVARSAVWGWKQGCVTLGSRLKREIGLITRVGAACVQIMHRGVGERAEETPPQPLLLEVPAVVALPTNSARSSTAAGMACKNFTQVTA